MDQVTLVSIKDKESFRYHLALTIKNLSFIKRNIYIYQDSDNFLNDLRSIVQLNFPDVSLEILFINESELLNSSVSPNKWIYQQLLKLSVWKLRKNHQLSDFFLFTDVDTLALNQLKESRLKLEDKYLFWMSTLNQEKNFTASNFAAIKTVEEIPNISQDTLSWQMAFSWSSLNLLGLNQMKWISAVDACAIWSVKVLEKLISFLEKKYNAPFYESILHCFRAFIQEHKDCFYAYDGYREVLFSYQPRFGLSASTWDEETLYHKLKVGFSEWQLYAYFLTLLQDSPHHYFFHLPNENPFICEYNAEVVSLDVLKKRLTPDPDMIPLQFVNFYPNIQPALELIDSLISHKD